MPCPSNFFLFDQPGNIVLRPETPKLSRCEKEGRCHSDTKSLSALYAMSCGGCLPTLCRKLPATWLFQADRAHNPEFCVLVVVLCGSGNRVIISSLSHRCGLFRWYCCGLVREFFGGKLFNPHCTRTCQNYSIRTTLESVKIIQSVLHRNVSKLFNPYYTGTCQNYPIRTTLERVKIIHSVLHRNVSKLFNPYYTGTCQNYSIRTTRERVKIIQSVLHGNVSKLFNPYYTGTCQNYSIRTTLERVKIIQSVLHRNVSKFVATWWSQSKLRLTVCVGVMWEENALRRMFRPNKEQGRRGVAEMTQSETYDLFAKGCYGTQLVCLG